MREKRFMQRTLVASAVAAALGCASGSAFADELRELKAEIAAQRAQMDAQRLRLEAMEKRLEAATAPVAARPAESKGFVPSLVASPDWEPGFKFQVTPVDTVTLYG